MILPARNAKSGTAPDALSVLNSVFGLPAFRGELRTQHRPQAPLTDAQ